MSAMASQVTGATIVYSAVCSGADQRKHQSPASLTFLRGIHRWQVNSPHKGPVTMVTRHVSIWWRHHGYPLSQSNHWISFEDSIIVARSRKSLATLTLGSSKINQHCWRFHGSGVTVIAAPQIIGLISFCTGMHHEYFFEVVNVLSCSPFMFENTENKQLDWRIRHSHLAPTLFHSLVPWWRPRRIRPQITRLSQLENSAMGTWPIYKNSIIPDWFEKWRDIKFWYRC